MTIKALYPNARPSLDINFARTKALDPRIAFTRASTGTYVDVDGLIKTARTGAPRFDHNSATGESLGLLAEAAGTNLMQWSQDMDAWPVSPVPTGNDWRISNVTVTANAALAPDSTMTADLVSETNVTGEKYIMDWGVYSTGSGAYYTHSVFVKPAGRSTFYFDYRDAVRTFFNLDTGVISGGSPPNAQFAGRGIIPLANGWFRVYVTGFGIGGYNTGHGVGISDGTTTSYAGDSSKGLYFWGHQVEASRVPTSYIPTTSATATRAADIATIPNANSSIFPASAFTVVNSPFGTAGGGSTVKLVGPTIKRTAVYAGDLPQSQINALTSTGDFWRWRVTGSSFALPSFTTNGSVTVDWGDGVVETLTTAAHAFVDNNAYHDIGFRLNSGTFFRPYIANNATYKDRVIAVGPAPASMKVDGLSGFEGCTALRGMDGYINYSITGGSQLTVAWLSCSSLVNFPLIDTAGVSSLDRTWFGCNNLTNFPLINTSSVNYFYGTWHGCSGLVSFPLINTGTGTNFTNTWRSCSSLTSFPLINTGAGTNFNDTWNGCSSLASFPLINTAAGTNFQSTWYNCSSLTSFPLINTGVGTNFSTTWANCSSLTSFPLINPGAATNFQGTWSRCYSLTSFPLISTGTVTNFANAWEYCTSFTSFPLINVSSGGNFYETWFNCSALISFPALNFASATTLQRAWVNCSSLSSFPANVFNTTGTLVSNAFSETFRNCALTAASIENILTSLVTNGQSNIQLGLDGGTNAGASTWTTAANTAYATLISRGWTISRNA
jgi:hypothetical protein